MTRSHSFLKSLLFVFTLAYVICPIPALADEPRFYEVVGVEEGDMLKLRAGPGIGYRIIVGLPNGTVVRLYDCQQIGSHEWCKVALKEARSLKGYVSWHYLRGL